MWDFRHNGKRVLARIIDNEWVRNFHSGAFALIPGDALRALVEKETNYGADREVLGVHFKVLKVYEVIRRR